MVRAILSLISGVIGVSADCGVAGVGYSSKKWIKFDGTSSACDCDTRCCKNGLAGVSGYTRAAGTCYCQMDSSPVQHTDVGSVSNRCSGQLVVEDVNKSSTLKIDAESTVTRTCYGPYDKVYSDSQCVHLPGDTKGDGSVADAHAKCDKVSGCNAFNLNLNTRSIVFRACGTSAMGHPSGSVAGWVSYYCKSSAEVLNSVMVEEDAHKKSSLKMDVTGNFYGDGSCGSGLCTAGSGYACKDCSSTPICHSYGPKSYDVHAHGSGATCGSGCRTPAGGSCYDCSNQKYCYVYKVSEANLTLV